MLFHRKYHPRPSKTQASEDEGLWTNSLSVTQHLCWKAKAINKPSPAKQWRLRNTHHGRIREKTKSKDYGQTSVLVNTWR